MIFHSLQFLFSKDETATKFKLAELRTLCTLNVNHIIFVHGAAKKLLRV